MFFSQVKVLVVHSCIFLFCPCEISCRDKNIFFFLGSKWIFFSLKSHKVCNQSWHWIILIMERSKEFSHAFCGLQISCSQHILAKKRYHDKIQETDPRLAVNVFSLLPLIRKISPLFVRLFLRKHPELFRCRTDWWGGGQWILERGGAYVFVLFYSEKTCIFIKIIECFRLEGSFKDNLVLLSQPHLHGHRNLLLGQAAQSLIQPGLYHLQQYGIHSFSGQLSPVPCHSLGNDFSSNI